MRVRVDVTRGPAAGQRFDFTRPGVLRFGRAPELELSVEDPFVSRHHFSLEVSPPHCLLRDAGSKNGVLVNAVKFGGQATGGVADAGVARLEDGDLIEVGKTELVISFIEARVCLGCACELVSRANSKPSGLLSFADSFCSRCQGFSDPHVSEQIAGLLQKACAPACASGAIAVQVEGYQLLEELGRGGMGVVFKARCASTGELVAIKTMLPGASERLASWFAREASVMQHLRHPNVVSLLAHGTCQQGPYFVMEYVQGWSLKEMLRSTRGLSLRQAAPLMLGVLDGVGYVHRVSAGRDSKVPAGIVHRDLKPENILIDTRNESWLPKVADFGLAKPFDSPQLTNLTQGAIVGTREYWSFEALHDSSELGPATDVFALGAIFVEMLTGAPARPGLAEMKAECRREQRAPDLVDYSKWIRNSPIPPLRQALPSLPVPVARVLDRALAEARQLRSPKAMRAELAQLRYPDALAFRDALALALIEAGLFLGLDA